jgi:hypothetical protein
MANIDKIWREHQGELSQRTNVDTANPESSVPGRLVSAEERSILMAMIADRQDNDCGQILSQSKAGIVTAYRDGLKISYEAADQLAESFSSKLEAVLDKEIGGKGKQQGMIGEIDAVMKTLSHLRQEVQDTELGSQSPGSTGQAKRTGQEPPPR